MPVRFVIIGGGPAGIQAATHAARLGAEVTLVERDIMGGAANLWDCIPSKAMIATGGVIGVTGRGHALGLTCTGATLDLPALAERIGMISGHLERSVTDLLTSQEVRVVRGRRGRSRAPARWSSRRPRAGSWSWTPTPCCCRPAAARGCRTGRRWMAGGS